MRKLLIGVMPLWDYQLDSIWMLPGYLDGVKYAGGLPVVLPLTDDRSQLEQIVLEFDGFLFTDGQDIAPSYYHEKPSPLCGRPCPIRDTMESRIFVQAAQTLNKPCLGIGRGLQLFNVLLGGTLYQNLPTQLISSRGVVHNQAPPYREPAHALHLDTQSPLYALAEQVQIQVNSSHHQGICVLAEDLTRMARASDGLIEAAYMPGRHFVWGVQWHPELDLHDTVNKRIFEAFVKACRS